MSREALSARIDGEREQVAAEQVDRHVATCAECASWYLSAVEATRRLRVRVAPTTPDLTNAILARAEAEGPIHEPTRHRRFRTLVHVLRTVFGLDSRRFRGRRFREDGPVALPPGARYGRRNNHLRASQDPAA